MENNFDLKKFLTENKLTSNSRLLEDFDLDFTAADDDDQYDADFGDDDGGDDGDDSQDPNKFDDQRNIAAWKIVKAALQGHKGRLLSFISYATDDRQETLNWGAIKEDGHSIGFGVGMDDDFKFITVDVVYDSEEQGTQMNNALKALEKYKDYKGTTSAHYKIPASEVHKIIQPLKTGAALATASKTLPPADIRGALGDKTGPMGPGPVDKPDGSVSIDGKRIKR
jgi:hypothetical protein